MELQIPHLAPHVDAHFELYEIGRDGVLRLLRRPFQYPVQRILQIDAADVGERLQRSGPGRNEQFGGRRVLVEDRSVTVGEKNALVDIGYDSFEQRNEIVDLPHGLPFPFADRLFLAVRVPPKRRASVARPCCIICNIFY